MAEGYSPDFLKSLDTGFTDRGYSKNNYDEDRTEVITQTVAPVSPSAIDFTKINTASAVPYAPGRHLEPGKLQQKKDSDVFMNGDIKDTKKKKKEGTRNGDAMFSKETDNVILRQTSEYSTEKDDEEKDKTRTEKRNQYIETAKLLVVLVCVALGVVAVVVLTTRYESPPKTQRLVSEKEFHCLLDSNSKTTTGKLRFNASISIKCIYLTDRKNILNSTLLVLFKPKYNLIQIHDSVEVNQTLHSDIIREGRWEISIKTSTNIEIKGDPVKCGGDGKFEITLQINNKSYTSQVSVEVESETSAVQLEVGQSEENGQYLITCSSTSECAPAPITLLGTVGGNIIPLYGVNFTCIIRYNDFDGWSAGCTGSIPKSVVSAIDEITCRPVLKNQTEASNTEAKVSKDVLLCNNDADCTFSCPEENQDRYYTDPKFCNIFHRCVDRRLYTAPCGKGTYFSTRTCACSHINEVIQDGSCNTKGERLATGSKKILCDDTNR
uniref:Uncharacterized protein LOC111137000 isoform X1 n=2 Tax=Crassostrea virginica TaxID=6565 RepID=A0A8B8EWB8_CRAVI|nr:uncharacterized protein LOC111137000 isoform X1 [Crassostrea virginica]XP_022343927.1 uncharacterized protein LOC111137000 isoform X2 [Crassostrea virginica]XP_022343928.1 uncharacterized protein LOC111137000 isoform X3 [Crassostrea virginica]